MSSTMTRSRGSATGSTRSTVPPPLQTRERRQEVRRLLGPKFANEQQREFFDSQAPEILYSGAFGAGKSRILCEKAYALAQRWDGAPIGIFRKVAASLAATTKLTFTKDVLRPRQVAYKENKTEGWIEFPNGSRVWFLGLDRDPDTGVPSKVGSLDLAAAYVDEAVELDEADWVMLEGRLRSDAMPYTQLGAATNPADPNHWLKRRFTPSTPQRVYLHAPTHANRLLRRDYLERIAAFTGLYRSRYAEGEWVAVEGALWNPDDFLVYRAAPDRWSNGEIRPEYSRIVIGVDPAVTAKATSDETGIIVAGIGVDGRGYVIEDLSGKFEHHVWARRIVQAYKDYGAGAVVVEVNNGGDLVKANLQAVDEHLPITEVRSIKSKFDRAAPIASLYKAGKVSHVRRFEALETQMCGYDPTSNVSPDRLDALVWAFTELMLEPTYAGDQFSMIA